MSKVQLLLHVISDLRNLADGLNAIADSISENESPAVDPQTASTSSATPVKPSVPIEQIRAVLADKSRLGKTSDVRDLLQRFGADKLSAIGPERYPELLKASEEL